MMVLFLFLLLHKISFLNILFIISINNFTIVKNESVVIPVPAADEFANDNNTDNDYNNDTYDYTDENYDNDNYKTTFVQTSILIPRRYGKYCFLIGLFQC